MKNIPYYLRNFLSFLFFLSSITFAGAQNAAATTTAGDEPVDLLRSNGLIYVVVGVIVIILGGLILYLTSIDKKVSRLEKEMRDK